MFEKLIPDTFDDKIKKRLETVLSRLKGNELHSYKWYKYQKYGDKTMSPYEELQILANFVKRYDLPFSTKREEKLYDKQKYYRGLGTSEFQTDLCFEDMLLNEQMKWLEKNIDNCQPIPTAHQKSKVHDLREYIIENAVPLEEIESQKSGNYVNKDYLKKHGIPHDEKNPTAEEIRFCEKFRESKPFNRGEVNKNCLETDKYEYRLNSYIATGNRKTYYVFVKIEKE